MANSVNPSSREKLNSSQDRPVVSVLIPTYNRADLLAQTIDSLLLQTYPNLQIIIVDDASTDHTEQMIQERFSGKVEYFREPVNSKGENVYTTGLKHVRGEFINFLDHDDLFLPEKIENQVRFLEENQDFGLVNCGYHYIDGQGQVLETHCNHYHGFNLEELLVNNLIWSGGPLIRRNMLEIPGLFEDRFWMVGDWSRWIRLAMSGKKCGYIPLPLGSYRILPDSEMSHVSDLEEWVIELLDRFFSETQLQEFRFLAAEAYAREYLFLGWRYFAKNDGANGKRCLEKAIESQPAWGDNPQLIRDNLVADAVSVRAPDPLEFLQRVFNHLPPRMEKLLACQDFVYGKTCLIESIKMFIKGKPDDGYSWFEKAISYDPSLSTNPELVTEAITNTANVLAFSDPIRYIELVFANLSSLVIGLDRYKNRVVGNILMNRIMQDYHQGVYHGITRRIIKACWINPTWIINRGAISIFSRTMIKEVLGIIRE